MNTKYYFSLLLATSLITFSCKDEKETLQSSTPKEIIMPRVQPLPVASSAASITQVPNQTVQAPAPQTMPVMPQPVTVAKGMNPAHGQPGHRCDIPVGAPLSTPVKNNVATGGPTKNNPYTVTQTSSPATITPAEGITSTTPETTPELLKTETTTTPPGINPPHGEKGHTCAVKVGEPLPK